MIKTSTFTALSIAATLLAAGCTQAPDSDKATVGDAKDVVENTSASAVAINTTDSRVEWVGTKVTGRHNGMFNISEGSLDMADGKLVGGNFTIDMQSLTVLDEGGGAKLQGHLMSPDFFNVSENPTAEFVVTGVESITTATADTEEVPEISAYRVADPTHRISGNLTMMGVTKGISFPAKVTMDGGNLTAMAKFNINRKDWGINYAGKPDDLIRDEVHLGIQITTKGATAMADDHAGHDHAEGEGH
jgi:polyisoprenoid-binding protein YceI